MADANLTEAQALALAVEQDERDWINSLYDLLAAAALDIAPVYINVWWEDLVIDSFPPPELDLTSYDDGTNYGFTIGGAGNKNLIVPTDGLYEVTATATVDVEDSFQPWLYVKKNGVSVMDDYFYSQLSTSGSTTHSLYCRFFINMNANDYFNLQIDESSMWSTFTVRKLLFTVVRKSAKTT